VRPQNALRIAQKMATTFPGFTPRQPARAPELPPFLIFRIGEPRPHEVSPEPSLHARGRKSRIALCTKMVWDRIELGAHMAGMIVAEKPQPMS